LITYSNLEKLPLTTLYELLSDRIETIMTPEKKADNELYLVQKQEIEIIQRVIDLQKENPVNA
jgi:hypothetical protein